MRNPYSVRPYQHVLEAVSVYLMIAQKQYEDVSYAGSYNVGLDDAECYSTGELVTLLCEKWKNQTGREITWKNVYDGGPHEALFLKLDSSKLKKTFDWHPAWNVERAMEEVVEWTAAYQQNEDIYAVMCREFDTFLEKAGRMTTIPLC